MAHQQGPSPPSTPTFQTLPFEVRLQIWTHLYSNVRITLRPRFRLTQPKQTVTGFSVSPLLTCRLFQSEITSTALPIAARSWILSYERCRPPTRSSPERADDVRTDGHITTALSANHHEFLEKFGPHITRVECKNSMYEEPTFHRAFDISWFPNLQTICSRSAVIVHRPKHTAAAPSGTDARGPISSALSVNSVDAEVVAARHFGHGPPGWTYPDDMAQHLAGTKDNGSNDSDVLFPTQAEGAVFWHAVENPNSLASRLLGVVGLRERWEANLKQFAPTSASKKPILVTVVLWDPRPGVNKVSILPHDSSFGLRGGCRHGSRRMTHPDLD
jgi:hypothetical protein